MYYAHFGLSEAPFRITPNTEVFFAGGNRGAILEALIYAISEGEGIVKVTGEVGTGKTMLCNMLQSRLPANIETVYLAHPSVAPEEILHAIAFELQLKVARDASRMEVMQALYAYLLERHAQNKQVVIFIEESQNMPIATLEEVRLLSNLETGKHKLLQIVLFGQPELDDNLRQPHIRQLRERITHSFSLQPLVPQEVGEYLMFRLRAVGYRGPDLFSAGVVKRIAQASTGLTRRINLIADKALLAAFSESTHTVQPKHVTAAIRDSEFARDSTGQYADNRRWLWVGAVALSLAVALAVYFGVRQLQAGIASSQQPSHAAAAGNAAPARAQRSLDAEQAPPGIESRQGAPADVSYPAPVALATRAKTAAPASAAGLVPETAVVKPQQPSSATLAEAAEAPPPSAEGSSSNQSDMLSVRLQATRRWLATQSPQTLTIQLLAGENVELLREHLSTIAKTVEAADIYVYRTVVRQRPFLAVLYGSFDSRETAQRALERLPPPLKAFKPYMRTVQGIREEMSRRGML